MSYDLALFCAIGGINIYAKRREAVQPKAFHTGEEIFEFLGIVLKAFFTVLMKMVENIL